MNQQDRVEKEKTAVESGPQEMYDIGQDIGVAVKNVTTEELLKPRMPDDHYDSLVNSLNAKQQVFFNHVLHSCQL